MDKPPHPPALFGYLNRRRVSPPGLVLQVAAADGVVQRAVPLRRQGGLLLGMDAAILGSLPAWVPVYACCRHCWRRRRRRRERAGEVSSWGGRKGTKQIDAMNESRGGLSANTVGKGLGEACACPMVFRYCKGRVIVGCCSRWQRWKKKKDWSRSSHSAPVP